MTLDDKPLKYTISRSGLNSLILVCTTLIILITYHIGLVAIPQDMDTKGSLVILIGVLAGIILLGAFGRKRGINEIITYNPRRIISAIFIGAAAILVIIALTFAGVHPLGMDPEVPFLFIIPPFALLIIVPVGAEESVTWLKLDKSKKGGNSFAISKS